MIHNQASRMATGLIKSGIINDASHDVYTYGFELLISTLINILIIALISVTFGLYFHWILFLAAFVPLRTTAGGYHASSHAKCIISGTVLFTLLLLLCKLQSNWQVLDLLFASMTLLTIILFSPVEADNKKLTRKRNKKNRTASITFGIMNLIVAVVTLLKLELAVLLSCYYLGVFAAGISMLVVKIQIIIRSSEK